MSRIYFFGALVILALLVAPQLLKGESGDYNWAPWGRLEEPKEPMTENVGSAPLERGWTFEQPKEVKAETAEDIVERLVNQFNQRYGYNLQPPEIKFIDGPVGEYRDGTIYIPLVSEYAIAHETCHYFQDETCRFEGYGESFCEVYAKADRKETECEEKRWPYYYCAPFRLEEVDRLAFLDCVFQGCEGSATKSMLMDCYEASKS